MTKQALNSYQSSITTAVDRSLTQIEDAIVDHAEQRLTDFLLNGGFQQRLMARMGEHHEQFAESIKSASPTRGLGFAKSAALPGGNRDA